MKACANAFGPIDNLQAAEGPPFRAGAGQVLVDAKAAAVNFPDALIVQGRYQSPALPFSPGAELAGTVAALGEGVRHLRSATASSPPSATARSPRSIAETAQVMPLLPAWTSTSGPPSC